MTTAVAMGTARVCLPFELFYSPAMALCVTAALVNYAGKSGLSRNRDFARTYVAKPVVVAVLT